MNRIRVERLHARHFDGTDHELFRAVHPDSGEERHVHFSRAGLTRLRAGLVKAGIDPRFFDWPPAHDPQRAPYRGMRPLDLDDAGIFFGREAPTIELLARLRGLRDEALPRFLVILGASGAGKSSFLRAGILPRLLRDDRRFLPLPILRPEQAALWGDNGLLRTLEHTMNLERAVGRSSGCVPRGVWQGTARRNSRSIPTSCNEARRRAGRALRVVATFTPSVSHSANDNLFGFNTLHTPQSGQLLFLGS